MVDITNKTVSLRKAVAKGELKAAPETIERIKNNTLPKGNLFDVARAASYLGAKMTPQLIPHCHPVALDALDVEFSLDEENSLVVVEARAKAIARTGLEMEALSAVSAGLLTVYDLLKPIDKSMEIVSMRLEKKSGGKSQFKSEVKPGGTAAVLVCSDSTSKGLREDKSGKIIKEMLESYGVEVLDYQIVPDEAEQIQEKITAWVQKDVHFILTTGGTGLSPRDRTADTIRAMLEKSAPGIEEAMRAYGQDRTPKAMFSRSVAGSIGKSMVVALPGSSAGARESLEAILPALFHGRSMLLGGGH